MKMAAFPLPDSHCDAAPSPSSPVAAVTKASLLYPTFCLALSTPLCLLLARQQWPGLAAAAAAWRSGALLVYGWSVGAHLLEVVFTEQVAMADDSDPAPTAPLLAALQHKDPIVQVSFCCCCCCLQWCVCSPVLQAKAGGERLRGVRGGAHL